MLYLRAHGIPPVFVKKVGKYQIPTYKYTKTAKLFRLVAEFYDQREKNADFDRMCKFADAYNDMLSTDNINKQVEALKAFEEGVSHADGSN